MTVDELRAELRKRADAEGGPMFMDWPDRWWDVFLRRCPNDHVSKTTLGTDQGDRCLACHEPVCMTFPEDADGPLVGEAGEAGEVIFGPHDATTRSRRAAAIPAAGPA